MEYILSKKPDQCIFCVDRNPAHDREKLILYRTPLSFVMMNRYPYCCGHLLVCPYRHVAAPEQLDTEEMLDLFATMTLCCTVLGKTARPEGFNVGININRAAGAGVEDHLHIHVVPRWVGDTNFMSVVDDVRVMPENLLTTYDRLLPEFRAARDAKD
jgi:ATP adenylyltransferase